MLENSIVLAEGAPAGGGGSPMGMIGFFVIMGVMIFFMFRSQRKQAKKREEMLNAIKKDDKVITAGGIYGTVVKVNEKSFLVQIADNVKIEVSKSGVNSIISKEDNTK
jgi:preprotein translocase subunit YajC